MNCDRDAVCRIDGMKLKSRTNKLWVAASDITVVLLNFLPATIPTWRPCELLSYERHLILFNSDFIIGLRKCATIVKIIS
jgi:hypothetical protein